MSSFTITRSSSQSSFAHASSQSSPKQTPEHLFGELASAYGLNGGFPGLPSRSSSPLPQSSRRSASHHQCPTTLTAVAIPSSSTKNYEQSYGNLVSTTAFGAGVLSLNMPLAQKKKATSKSNTATSTPLTLSRTPSTTGSHTSSHKDYEHGFGQLAKTYEFGSHLAVPAFSMSK